MPVRAFLRDLAADLGPAGCVTDPEVVRSHTVDWTGRWRGQSPAVVRPRGVEEAVAVVEAARRHRVPLVPQGGNTGLVGGGVPLAGEVVVDLRRLDRLEPVDVEAGQVTVGAGATLEAVQAHARATGLEVGVDLASRGTATIGGMVATNAGGIHVLRHGPMRHQVLGVEAVLGTGSVLEANLRGLVKDNTGYDLPGLLCGSEGTLGLVTAARLRLVPTPPARIVALLAVARPEEAVAALPPLRAMPGVRAIEVISAAALELVSELLGPAPVRLEPPGCLVLVEVAGPADGLADQLGPALLTLGPMVLATAVAEDPAGGARLWRWRELIPDAVARLGVVHKADVTLPLANLATFWAEVGAAVHAVAPGSRVVVYGHLGDGNLHVNVVGPDADDDRPVAAVLDLALELGGSVSAEHGIGVAKRPWLLRQRGASAVATMAAIKRALDPDRILNPGVLLP